eukprot:scaffold8859_cov135-Isochrysis_galbana.AAC.1
MPVFRRPQRSTMVRASRPCPALVATVAAVAHTIVYPRGRQPTCRPEARAVKSLRKRSNCAACEVRCHPRGFRGGGSPVGHARHQASTGRRGRLVGSVDTIAVVVVNARQWLLNGRTAVPADAVQLGRHDRPGVRLRIRADHWIDGCSRI